MIVLKILDVKKFMAGFMAGDMLDSYRMANGSITTFCTFRIDGIYHKEFYQKDEPAVPSAGSDSSGAKETSFVSWKEVRPFCFSIIRGKHTPLAFKFVFYKSREQAVRFFQANQISFEEEAMPELCLNLKFDQTGLFLTTGISRKFFSMDRSVDEAWDQYIKKCLQNLGITAESII